MSDHETETWIGDGARRIPVPADRWPRDVLDALRAIPEVHDAVVTERFAAVYFDPARPPPPLAPYLEAIPVRTKTPPARTFLVRVRYDGPDLEELAARAGLAPADVIAAHAAKTYQVLMLGFLPGFAYLGDVDARIAAPRRASPRPRVPARSVAIAARYTGIYPFACSGGWNLVGQALDFDPFDPVAGARLSLGDRVRFEAA